jgi:GT2 family glycosyltransferase/glycosyltransferase involved in cell wall biosynthesis
MSSGSSPSVGVGSWAEPNGLLREPGSGEHLLRSIVFDRPERLVGPPAWIGHIPFAFWLIDVLRPGKLVELGTHTGNSYSAFAQAIQRIGLPTECYAVDTWQGDEHASFYGESVFEEFSAYHEARFRSFSRLLRMTFDEALPYFSDGTVDLLHIDGLHTYDAVKHDFDTWLPKVSRRGVVLLHDVNVREHKFGVWSLWEELSRRYPSFLFDHSHGLGVLGVGPDQAPAMSWLFGLAKSSSGPQTAGVRTFFSTLGGSLLDSFVVDAAGKRLTDIERRFEVASTELSGFRRHAQETASEMAVLRAQAQRQRERAADLERQMAAQRERWQRAAHARADKIFGGQRGPGGRLGSLRESYRLGRVLRVGWPGFLVGRSPLAVRLALVSRYPLSSEMRGAQHRAVIRAEQAVAGLRTIFSKGWQADESLNPADRGAASLIWYLEGGWRDLDLYQPKFHPLFDAEFYVTAYPDVARSALAPIVHYAVVGAAEGRQPHALFDPEFYKAEAAAAGVPVEGNPLAHYLEHGASLRCSPHPLFHTDEYVETNPGAAESGEPPLLHYLKVGQARDAWSHPLFDLAHYREQVEAVGEDVSGDPLLHFLQHGERLGRSPHHFFDADFYARQTAAMGIAVNGNPLVHYLRSGEKLGCKPNALFDPVYYAEQAAGAGETIRGSAAVHYLRHGERLGLRPHPLFDREYYTDRVAAAGHVVRGNPVVHYLRYGEKLGCNPHPMFDAAYYREQAAAAGVSVKGPAIAHYLGGGAKLFNPHPLFDGLNYLSLYPDVADAGANPLVHYVRTGCLENRQPSRTFSPRGYLAAYPDVGKASMDPFYHYVRWGHAEGRRTWLSRARARDLLPVEPAAALPPARATVDVVVPVYAGVAETRRCIDSLLASASRNATLGRIVVVNDRGPESAMQDYLATLRSNSRIAVLDNDVNVGFVASVNRGMDFAYPHDVILLNSDTEVADDWVDRLAAQAHADDKVGSVTPFSNNATICSYPNIPGQVELPPGETTGSLDAAFARANRGRSLDLPTAIGFCMYIKRACLDEIGLFDTEAFGRGYGEENDFCLRSATRGWRHILAGDVFVYHVGETSFAGESARRKQEATEIINARYPSYASDVARFVDLDTPAPLRLAATAERLRHGDRPVILAVMHGLGGGVAKHVRELATRFSDRARHLILQIDGDKAFTLTTAERGDGLETKFRAENAGELVQLVRAFGVQRIHVHHALGYKSELQHFLKLSGIPYDLTIHDYMLICPRFYMFGTDSKYCGEPDEIGCLTCLGSEPIAQASDILWWRWEGRELIEDAERVICPSQDVAGRIVRYAPRARVLVAPHEDPAGLDDRGVSVPALAEGEPMRVAVLGTMAKHKGSAFLIDCAAACRKAGVNVAFTAVGYFEDQPDIQEQLDANNIQATGPYAAKDVGNLIAKADPHVIFYPQRVPETYSYSLSEGFRAGVPLLVPELGAFPERVAGREWCWLYKLSATPSAMAQLLARIRNEHIEKGQPPAPPAVAVAGRAPSEWFYKREFLAWATDSAAPVERAPALAV